MTELYDETKSEPAPREPAAQSAVQPPPAPPAAAASQVDDLIAAVRRLEKFAADESSRVSKTLVPKLEANARENIWVSLLLALGLGVILGLWLGGGRRRG